MVIFNLATYRINSSKTKSDLNFSYNLMKILETCAQLPGLLSQILHIQGSALASKVSRHVYWQKQIYVSVYFI